MWSEAEMMMLLDVKRSWWCDKMWIDDDDVIKCEVEVMMMWCEPDMKAEMLWCEAMNMMWYDDRYCDITTNNII